MLNLRDPIRVILEQRGKSSLIAESTTQMYNNLLDEDDDDADANADANAEATVDANE